MEYLKLFSSHTDYEEYLTGGTMVKPNVSYCKDVKDVHYNPYIHDYSQDYFTTVALENGTISFDIWSSMGTDMITSISYSTDNGETWTTTNNVNDKAENLVITVNVNEGDQVLWKGDAQQFGFYDHDHSDYVGSFFSSTCSFDAMGNVMSFIYGDNFVGETTIEKECCFLSLFFDYDENKSCGVVNANNLVLPATTLSNQCYQGMFRGCTSLTSAPQLPATTLADYCYYYMFRGCTSLTSTPQLPATTLTDYCYQNMFYGCTSLTSAPELPATTLAEECYVEMFRDCISLTSAPELPATTLTMACYGGMFGDCTSLLSAPELPATTLSNQCYQGMFNGCTNLTTAPQLPATTLADACYCYMFNGCTSLTTAPELPATTLTDYCYEGMFQGCTSLNYIKAMFTTTPSITYTDNWVYGVAASGTFVKNSAATWNVSGVNGVPNGWTIQTASA